MNILEAIKDRNDLKFKRAELNMEEQRLRREHSVIIAEKKAYYENRDASIKYILADTIKQIDEISAHMERLKLAKNILQKVLKNEVTEENEKYAIEHPFPMAQRESDIEKRMLEVSKIKMALKGHEIHLDKQLISIKKNTW